MFQSRTHTCNELRLENAGEQVRIVGWMENVREVGQNFAFVVVRDFYGTTQVVIETEDMMKVVKSLNKESTIAVEGTVRERASKNPKLPTGDIEVVPTKIEVLGRCRYNELPFEINRSRDADEALRLTPQTADAKNAQAVAYIRQKDYAKAWQALGEAADINSANMNVLANQFIFEACLK